MSTSDRRVLDPWANVWVSLEEYPNRVYAQAEIASTLRYRLRRRWVGMTTGVWLPTARFLYLKAARFAASAASNGGQKP